MESIGARDQFRHYRTLSSTRAVSEEAILLANRHHTLYILLIPILSLGRKGGIFVASMLVSQPAVAALKLLTGSADGFFVGDFVCR